jgi:hypothetical protein
MSNFNNFSNQPHRYSLEKGSKKHHCPDCNKKTFVLYIDTETGDYLPEQYGRCDRESKCSYHLNPYLDGYAKVIWEQEKGNRSELPNNWKPKRKKAIPQPPPEPVFFDVETFKQTLQPERYEKNTFIQNLFYRVQFPFEVDEVTKVIQLYRLGTIIKGSWTGAVTLPYIDKKGFVRTVQVKKFDEQNHTTAQNKLDKVILSGLKKENRTVPEWLTKHIEYGDEYGYFTCLFGEHLLSKYHSNPVALVEAPKTAVYGTLYFGLPETPESLIWLAVYNKSSFSFDKMKVLQGRFVYVFPDLSKDGNTFKEWETKAKEYESRLPGTRFIFSDLLEQLAPERDKSEGNDLADYLIKQDWRLFRKRNIQEQPPQPEPEKVTKVIKVTNETNLFFRTQSDPQDQRSEQEAVKPHQVEIEEPPQKPKGIDWSHELMELEAYFSGIEVQPLRLDKVSNIINPRLFVESHISLLKSNNGNNRFFPYLRRLQKYKSILKTTKKNKYHGTEKRND